MSSSGDFKTRVVVAEDHPMMRFGIRNLLTQAADIEVVGEASDGAEALHLVEKLNPDVLLLDMEMPVIKGIDVARILNDSDTPVPILVLSAYDDKQYILGMLDFGAAGYLTKDEGPDMLLRAVRGVAKGERGWLSQSVAAQVITWKKDEELSSIELSERERDVLQLVIQGRKNREIADKLGISKKTVEKRLGKVFAKLGVTSRVEAVKYALTKGLV